MAESLTLTPITWLMSNSNLGNLCKLIGDNVFRVGTIAASEVSGFSSGISWNHHWPFPEAASA